MTLQDELSIRSVSVTLSATRLYWMRIAHRRNLLRIRQTFVEMEENLRALQLLAQQIQRLSPGKDCRSTLSRYNFYYECDKAGHDCFLTQKRAMRYMEHICDQVLTKQSLMEVNLDNFGNDLHRQVHDTLQAECTLTISLLTELRERFNSFMTEQNKAVEEIDNWSDELDSRECFGCVMMYEDQTYGKNEKRLFRLRY